MRVPVSRTPLLSVRRLFLAPLLLALLAPLPLATAALAEDGEILDPCKLVTPTEVEAVLGTPVTNASEAHVKDPVKFPIRICMFRGKNGRNLNLSTGLKTAADFDQEWTGHTAVAGLGEGAYMVPPGLLTFHKGPSTVLFQALNFNFARDSRGNGYPDPALAAKLKTLALAAASRM